MKEIFTENSFYYFYSTVPQVLAGGIALIGAFLIFFIAESNKKIYQIINDACSQIYSQSEPRYSEIRDCIGDEYMNKVEEIEYIEKKYYYEIIKRINRCFKGKNKVVSRNFKQFKLELDLKSNITKRGIQAIILTGTLMGISIIILPFVQYLIKFLPLGIFITVLIIGFSCYAIYLIANVVVSAIRKL